MSEHAATLTRPSPIRFSVCADCLPGGARPGHGEAGRDPKCGGALAAETLAVLGRRLAHDVPERAAEGAEAVEADLEAHVRGRVVGLAQKLHRALDAAAL